MTSFISFLCLQRLSALLFVSSVWALSDSSKLEKPVSASHSSVFEQETAAFRHLKSLRFLNVWGLLVTVMFQCAPTPECSDKSPLLLCMSWDCSSIHSCDLWPLTLSHWKLCWWVSDRTKHVHACLFLKITALTSSFYYALKNIHLLWCFMFLLSS